MLHKKAGLKPAFLLLLEARLLDLGFLVDHVLANHGIVLLDLHLVWHGALVLVRGVVMPGVGTRYQLDLVSHNNSLPMLALSVAPP